MEVVNVTGTALVTLSYDGTANPANPTIGGNDFEVLPAAAGATITIQRLSSLPMVFKSLSPGTPTIAFRPVT